jgi:hypothetical protein
LLRCFDDAKIGIKSETDKKVGKNLTKFSKKRKFLPKMHKILKKKAKNVARLQ